MSEKGSYAALGTSHLRACEATGVAEEKVRGEKANTSALTLATVFLPGAMCCAPVFSGKYLIMPICAPHVPCFPHLLCHQPRELVVTISCIPDRLQADSVVLVLQMEKWRPGEVEEASFT